MMSLPKEFEKMLDFPKMGNFPKMELGKLDDFPKMDLEKMSKNAANSQNGYTHCHSSVIKFDEKGQKYKKTHTISTGPNGVKQEQKTIEDRDEKYKEMMLGNHIKNRGLEIEKSKKGDNPISTRRNIIGMTEEELPEFEKDWSKVVGTSSGLLNIGYGPKPGRNTSGNGRKAVK